MPRPHAYPPDLAGFVEANWPSEEGLPLPGKLFAEALSAAFQASLTSEEGRPTRFRLLLTPVERLPVSGAPIDGVLRLQFDRSRPLTTDELRRLSPSAPFESTLIGAQQEGERMRIWGIAHSGPAWLAPSWGGRSVVPNWTFDPIIHVTGPGRLAVRCAGKLVGALERGVISDAMLDVFDSQWLPLMFAAQREEVLARHAALQAKSASPTLAEHSLVGRVSQQMLRRAIQLVRGSRHGGLILVAGAAPDERAQLLDGLRLKYHFAADEEPPRRYRTLLTEILVRLAAASSKASIGWDDFASNDTQELEKLEQAVFEQSRLIANLTSTDGAVVLDKRFTLLGFGAEVSAELPSPRRIWRALDTEGTQLELGDAESVGTRHRAAYRFVESQPQGLAFVISQDGGVSVVANRAGEVVFWEQSVSP